MRIICFFERLPFCILIGLGYVTVIHAKDSVGQTCLKQHFLVQSTMLIPPQLDTSSAGIAKPVSGQANAVTTGSGVSSASLMPTPRQTINGVEASHPTSRSTPDFTNMQHARIYSPRQAPSAVTSENFLAARASLSPGFVHNAAQSNIARISNMYRDAPRFRNEIDILI